MPEVVFKPCAPNFNPRPREEGDQKVKQSKKIDYNFNPRPREEGDGATRRGSYHGRDFNPRPREEGDRL